MSDVFRSFSEDERKHFETLPNINDDASSWQKCGPCAQGQATDIHYKDCATCEFLNRALLDSIVKMEKYFDYDDPEKQEEV